jgi:hypothetical protein
VEYSSAIHADAELIDAKWFFEDSDGGIQPFFFQQLVKPLNDPSPNRRHPPEMSGRTLSRSK